MSDAFTWRLTFFGYPACIDDIDDMVSIHMRHSLLRFGDCLRPEDLRVWHFVNEWDLTVSHYLLVPNDAVVVMHSRQTS